MKTPVEKREGKRIILVIFRYTNEETCYNFITTQNTIVNQIILEDHRSVLYRSEEGERFFFKTSRRRS